MGEEFAWKTGWVEIKRRIESKSSRTAEFNCLIRYLSYTEAREAFKSNDFLSPLIVNSALKALMRSTVVRRCVQKYVYPFGMYEYVVSRTKWIDDEFEKALAGGIEQVCVFGAGFDTRGIRFGTRFRDVRFFELDAPTTQRAKVQRYAQKGIETPENLAYVPVDFDTDSVWTKLSSCGFDPAARSLVLLEGLTMYLEPDSAAATFQTLGRLIGQDSVLIFDCIYASVVRRENLYQGEQALCESVDKHGERFRFGIEKGQIGEYLRPFGFTPVGIADSQTLENKYFRQPAGNLLARVNGTHCIVKAVPGNGIPMGENA